MLETVARLWRQAVFIGSADERDFAGRHACDRRGIQQRSEKFCSGTNGFCTHREGTRVKDTKATRSYMKDTNPWYSFFAVSMQKRLVHVAKCLENQRK